MDDYACVTDLEIVEVVGSEMGNVTIQERLKGLTIASSSLEHCGYLKIEILRCIRVCQGELTLQKVVPLRQTTIADYVMIG